MIAPDSATVTPSSVITGDLPSGCTLRSSGGASIVFASRWYFWISYGRPSSSSSQSTRCERELLRWWTVITAGFAEWRSGDCDGRRADNGRVPTVEAR